MRPLWPSASPSFRRKPRFIRWVRTHEETLLLLNHHGANGADNLIAHQRIVHGFREFMAQERDAAAHRGLVIDRYARAGPGRRGRRLAMSFALLRQAELLQPRQIGVRYRFLMRTPEWFCPRDHNTEEDVTDREPHGHGPRRPAPEEQKHEDPKHDEHAAGHQDDDRCAVHTWCGNVRAHGATVSRRPMIL